MAKKKTDGWHFNRQVNLAVVVQLMFLASLIVGSWVNLQRQLYVVQHDIARILECQKDFQQRVETLAAKSIEYECRLQTAEKSISQVQSERDVY
jgi:uncharacterized membrane protein (DUF106 family)